MTICEGCGESTARKSGVCDECLRHYWLNLRFCACDKCDAVRTHGAASTRATAETVERLLEVAT